MALTLTRKPGEFIMIEVPAGEARIIRVELRELRKSAARISIHASKDVVITRPDGDAQKAKQALRAAILTVLEAIEADPQRFRLSQGDIVRLFAGNATEASVRKALDDLKSDGLINSGFLGPRQHRLYWRTLKEVSDV